MAAFETVLILATFLCSLVAGFLFAFAVVVMPGIKNLDDAGFIRAFQVIDRVIQDSRPLFVLVWIGSAVTVLAAAVLGALGLHGVDLVLAIAAALIHVLCVQLPTFKINIPLNNALQRLDSRTMTADELEHARAAFEPGWNRWNEIRTACASFAALLLMLLLVRV